MNWQKKVRKFGQIVLLLALAGNLSSCDSPQLYGSIGISSYSGGGSRVGGSISIGGRIR